MDPREPVLPSTEAATRTHAERGKHLGERATALVEHDADAHQADAHAELRSLLRLAFPRGTEIVREPGRRWRVFCDRPITLLAVIAHG